MKFLFDPIKLGRTMRAFLQLLGEHMEDDSWPSATEFVSEHGPALTRFVGVSVLAAARAELASVREDQLGGCGGGPAEPLTVPLSLGDVELYYPWGPRAWPYFQKVLLATAVDIGLRTGNLSNAHQTLDAIEPNDEYAFDLILSIVHQSARESLKLLGSPKTKNTVALARFGLRITVGYVMTDDPREPVSEPLPCVFVERSRKWTRSWVRFEAPDGPQDSEKPLPVEAASPEPPPLASPA